jgi:hypothetical protein
VSYPEGDPALKALAESGVQLFVVTDKDGKKWVEHSIDEFDQYEKEGSPSKAADAASRLPVIGDAPLVLESMLAHVIGSSPCERDSHFLLIIIIIMNE